MARNQETIKRWRKNNPEAYLETSKRYWEKKKLDAMGRLNNSFSTSLYRSLKNKKAGSHWEDLVDYSLGQLKRHLEKQFLPGMSWENYGPIWHIDHIIPKTAFNFNKETDFDFKRCWGLENL